MLRAPEGERELEPGDAVLFPSGPDGAHQLTNRTTDPVRVLIVSSFTLPRAAVQVESNKLMIRWGLGEGERRWFFLDDAAGYWDSARSGRPTSVEDRRAQSRLGATVQAASEAGVEAGVGRPAPHVAETDTLSVQSWLTRVTQSSIA